MTLKEYRKIQLLCFVGAVLIKITQAECDFSKIFRTPKDMRKVNFDHLEILERADFDPCEPTTASPAGVTPTTTENPTRKNIKASDRNVANAQVMLRFGGDNVEGSNSIVKVPHQCRPLVGSPHADSNNVAHNHNTFHPSCHPQYYYPYSPPAPYAYPNYYYYSHYGNQSPYSYVPQEYHKSNLDINSNDKNKEEQEELSKSNIKSILNKLLKKYNTLSMKDRYKHIFDKNDESTESNSEESNLKMTIKGQPNQGLISQRIKSRILRSLDSNSNEKSKDETNKVLENSENDDFNNNGKEHEMKSNLTTPENDMDSRELEESDEFDFSSEKNIENINTLLNNALMTYKCKNCNNTNENIVSYPALNENISTTEFKELLSSTESLDLSEDIDKLIQVKNISEGCLCKKCKELNSTEVDPKFMKSFEELLNYFTEKDHTLGDTKSNLAFVQKYLAPILEILKTQLGLSKNDDNLRSNDDIKISSKNNNFRSNEIKSLKKESGIPTEESVLDYPKSNIDNEPFDGTKPQLELPEISNVFDAQANFIKKCDNNCPKLQGANDIRRAFFPIREHESTLTSPRYIKVLPIFSQAQRNRDEFLAPNFNEYFTNPLGPEYARYIPNGGLIYPVRDEKIGTQESYGYVPPFRPPVSSCTGCGCKCSGPTFCPNCGYRIR
ncbi:probable serine/threonine-protein kinase DDB_G0278845 [Sitophilus oryzae]|uniref:Probable serine/threonine-protein kinase DDB_G0278845 n=1 Tax=Sitophilus oryzae TaxID=7048 RepID=A0A6J2X9M1_SITOR|nr:probable serine/threonine-protein kinase DDB_G0278845 [Sitophilus oryzae]